MQNQQPQNQQIPMQYNQGYPNNPVPSHYQPPALDPKSEESKAADLLDKVQTFEAVFNFIYIGGAVLAILGMGLYVAYMSWSK